jgi:hypothetical protein
MTIFRHAHLRIAVLFAVLLTLALSACRTDPGLDAEPRTGPLSRSVVDRLNPQPPSALEPRPERPLEPVLAPADAPARPRLDTLAADTDRVRLSVLVIGTIADDPALHAWHVLLEQAGIPYETFLAASQDLTPDVLVSPDGVGRFQAVLLTTSQLGHQGSSALRWDEWNLLWQYEREFGVRQVVLYGFPSTWPEDLGIEQVSAGTVTSVSPAMLRPTAAGAGLFDDLASGAEVPIPMESELPLQSGAAYSVYMYRTRLTTGSTAVPLLEDASGNVLAVTSTAPDGRERLMLTFDQAAYEGVPLLHTQLLGHDLLQWATKGVHLGEHRLHLGADVDDWFIPSDLWNTSSQGIDLEAFDLSANDAEATSEQQQALRTDHPIASDLTWTMAFNGRGADPNAVSSCDPSTASLSAITKCLAGDFFWVNHTWSHAYMDAVPENPITYAQIYDEIALNDGIVDDFGFGATFAPKSLVTGDISGLGWYATPLGGQPKVDYGLEASNPDLLSAAAALGRAYIASNMSTPSHEPDCGACGIVHPLDADILLVPRWPTNVFYSVSTPAAAVQAYNLLYSAARPGSQNYYSRDLSYDEYLAAESDIALRHVLSGAPYPHYFHVANLFEHATGRSLLYDWTDRLLDRYGDVADLPLRSPDWDELGAYVAQRTSFAATDASGVWDRAAGTVTITAAQAGTVFATGVELSPTNKLSYGGELISWIALSSGQTVTASAGTSDPPPTPEYHTLTTTAAGQGSVTGGGDYLFYEMATVTATPDEGWRFVEWTGDLTGDTNPAGIAMTMDRWVSAHFAEKLAQTITFAPLADRTTANLPFEVLASATSGLPVTLSATGVCSLSGTTLMLTGDPGSCTVSATQTGDATYLPATDVTREFDVTPAQAPIHAATVSLHGTGFGVVVSSPVGLYVTSSGAASFDEGTSVTLIAVPMPGSTFTGWSGACGGTEGCVVLLDDDVAVDAVFEVQP